MVKIRWNVLNLDLLANFQNKNYLGQAYLVSVVPKILQKIETQMIYTFVISENVEIVYQPELQTENTDVGPGDPKP